MEKKNEMIRERIKKSSLGITLIALVVTIVIIIILSGVSLNMVLGENGIIKKAKEAATNMENAQVETEKELNSLYDEISTAVGSTATITEAQNQTKMKKKKYNTTVKDANNNKIVVPAGFYITADATDVTQGIVISDGTNEFVWIPVGTIHTELNGDKTITLGRYTFASDGAETLVQSGENYVETGTSTVIDLYFQELATSSYGNSTAKDIVGFINSANQNGGYYIGRYEARTATARAAKTDALTIVTENGNQYIYNYVTQLQAATLSRNMYKDATTYTSDLINSYAWDTAIVFIQAFSGSANYLTSKNTSLATTGTNNISTKDKVCNIYDMAGNLYEWTTETCNVSGSYCTSRSSCYMDIINPVSTRAGGDTVDGWIEDGFRPTLYCNPVS